MKSCLTHEENVNCNDAYKNARTGFNFYLSVMIKHIWKTFWTRLKLLVYKREKKIFVRNTWDFILSDQFNFGQSISTFIQNRYLFTFQRITESYSESLI